MNFKQVRKRMSNDFTFRMALALIVSMAVANNCVNALVMGIVFMIIMVLSSFAISALKSYISENGKLVGHIIIVATLTSIVNILMQAFFAAYYKNVSFYIVLISVNILIYAEGSYWCEQPIVTAVRDAVKTSLMAFAILLIVGILREILGSASLFGVKILGDNAEPMSILTRPAGGYIILGVVLGIINALVKKRNRRAE